MLKIQYPGLYSSKRVRASRGRFYDPNSKDKVYVSRLMRSQCTFIKEPLSGPLGCICVFCKKWPKSFSKRMKKERVYWDTKPDSDNLEKFLFDALEKQANLIQNDSRICAKLTIKIWGKDDFTSILIGRWENTSYFVQYSDMVGFNNVGYKLHHRQFFQLSDVDIF